jgi:hypothetical protein
MKLSRKEYTSDEEKKKDFWIGFAVWFILNVVLCLLQLGAGALVAGLASTIEQGGGASETLISAFSLVTSLLPWVINIGLMIYFALTRSQIALGMLAAFGAALVLVIVAGVLLTTACFILAATYQ